MWRSLLILTLIVVLLVVAVDRLVIDTPPHEAANTPELIGGELEPIVPPGERAPSQFVADVSVSTPQELERLFERVEALLERPGKAGEPPFIAVILHGPEIEFFLLDNYPQHKALVDRAAKLAALGAVRFNICETQMRARGIANDQVPAFLERVPYGPEEVGRLENEGYIRM